MTTAAAKTSSSSAGDVGTEVSLGTPAGDAGDKGAGTSAETELSLGAPAEKKTVDPKGAEGKAGEGTKVPPAPIELKLPEGLTKDDAVVKEFSTDAAELGLNAEAAQKLFDKHLVKGRESFRESITSQVVEGVEAQVKEWEGALKTDKEFGGAKFAENFEVAKQGLEKTATPELKQFLYESGLGSHPEFVRHFYRLGLERAEDSSAGTGGGTKTPGNDSETLFDALYPTMKKQG